MISMMKRFIPRRYLPTAHKLHGQLRVFPYYLGLRLPRFRRVGEEKSGTLYEGGYDGQTPTKVYEGIQARGSTTCRNE